MSALIVVPPLLKYTAGPLLGPAVLEGAGLGKVLDLNIRYLRQHLPRGRVPATGLAGDHDRPSEALRRVQDRFSERVRPLLPPSGWDRNPGLTLACPHDRVLAAARALARAPDVGGWVRAQLPVAAPDELWLSVMFSGQVLWAMVVTLVARERWPGITVRWGGAHVTALRDAIGVDPCYGEVADEYVVGPVVDPVAPVFRDLALYGNPRLTLPAQTSRGCAYGRCTYCTYAAIEGAYREFDLEPLVEPVIRLAERWGGVVSLKDSLVLPGRLLRIAELVGGRVPWSACTKLHWRFTPAFLASLAASGCATLEVGLETLVPASQRLIDKRQSPELFLSFLDAAERAGPPVVINTITGFPGEDPAEAARWQDWIRRQVEARTRLTAKVEHNVFELERLAPLAGQLRVAQSWPWASVLGWRDEQRVAAK